MDNEGANDPGRAPTIYDVAKAAGVAPSTVSRALARPGRVSAATAEKVRDAAALLGYRRSSVAPVLSSVNTRMLAMVVADIGNPLFVDVIRGAEAAAEAAGYTMLLFDAQESYVRERDAAEKFLSAVDGLVLTSPRLSDLGIRAIAKQRPVIVLNRVVSGLPSVLTDGARGVRRAAEHLGQLGHREITYVAGPEASWADGVRWRGLEEAGLELELRVRRIGPNAPTVEGGAKAARRWAQNPSTAVVAFNDIMAVGFVRGLRALGVSVPGDVSVVGFDNSRTGALTVPALTSVASPLSLQGATAVRNLLAIIGGARSSEQPVVLPVKLIARDSTARVRRGRLMRS
ncbi:LacI family transcriptional regulator [Georgenia sp. 311]|uniref:LacI family DNA-binding transcriptional regulator n=1 Tax=Georgenia sp. 311 TaxID=2585134 RepID=UPI0011126B2D|nr:LacI family DNA-binding transcriptional regulator [Georgenia sp. 311]TNC16565.1 LacI family transcriptional regulator [Georgenia sp. 311]